MGLRYGITKLVGDESYASLPFMLSQLIFMALVPVYFTAPIKYGGQTPGMRFLGLRVVDQRGRNPDGEAALVRFAYFLISCLFVFPFFGYLFVLFRKTKQGLHDQLAGTLVVHNAEVLGGIVLAQLVNPGTPCMYGSSTTIFDMKHGTATVGAPEFGMINAALAELAHYYEVPVTVGGL